MQTHSNNMVSIYQTNRLRLCLPSKNKYRNLFFLNSMQFLLTFDYLPCFFSFNFYVLLFFFYLRSTFRSFFPSHFTIQTLAGFIYFHFLFAHPATMYVRTVYVHTGCLIVAYKHTLNTHILIRTLNTLKLKQPA